MSRRTWMLGVGALLLLSLLFVLGWRSTRPPPTSSSNRSFEIVGLGDVANARGDASIMSVRFRVKNLARHPDVVHCVVSAGRFRAADVTVGPIPSERWAIARVHLAGPLSALSISTITGGSYSRYVPVADVSCR